MKKFLLFWVGVCVCSGVWANDTEAITQKLLKQTMDRGIEILQEESTEFDAKIDAFEVLLEEYCHTELMAKLVLGRSGWVKFSKEQRSEFIHVFIQMLTSSYYSKMDMADLSSIEISYGENEEVSPKKRLLKAEIKDDSGTYQLEYKFAYINDRWGIYDLVVEGISFLASYRAEYADYLTQHTGAELIDMLNQKVEEICQ